MRFTFTVTTCRRDERVTNALSALGVCVEQFNDNYLATPDQVLKDASTPYTVFTRFRLRFEGTVVLPNRFVTHAKFNTPHDISSLDLPAIKRDDRFARGGESEGLKLARVFMRREYGLARYRDMRDLMASDATSHLSPHLHFGTMLVRELVHAAREADTGKQAKAWIDELVWREFYATVLYHFPHAATQSFRPGFENIAWENDAEIYAAWREGRTGYPIVDTLMRQLNTMGWMDNRARMIVASSLTEDLPIHWRRGEKYFLQHLIVCKP